MRRNTRPEGRGKGTEVKCQGLRLEFSSGAHASVSEPGRLPTSAPETQEKGVTGDAHSGRAHAAKSKYFDVSEGPDRALSNSGTQAPTSPDTLSFQACYTQRLTVERLTVCCFQRQLLNFLIRLGFYI